MKVFHRSHLPETIEYNGKTFTVNHELSRMLSQYDPIRNAISRHSMLATIDLTLKSTKHSCVMVRVLSKTLRAREDNHGKMYQPTEWIYTTEVAHCETHGLKPSVWEELTIKGKKVYLSILQNFPGTSRETALDKAYQEGVNIQFICK